MTDLLSLWREARGPEPELPEPVSVIGHGPAANFTSVQPALKRKPHGSIKCFAEDDARAHYAAAVTEDALARFAELLRERMIADGWRQTRYVAPVTDCEACLTPDACAIRGQCGHYLRERAQA